MRKPVLSACLLLLCIESAFSDVCSSLSSEQLSAELASLNETIQHHDRLYFQEHQPDISDAEYDALVERQKTLNECQPSMVPLKSLPSGNIRHIHPMTSLQKGKDKPEIQRFIESINHLGSPVLLQPKVDGVAVELVYQNGRLVQASTRGDREWGEDILPTIQKIPHIPKQLDTAIERIVLQGEVFARLDLVKGQLSNYVSARHFTAAMLQADQPEPDNLTVLDFFPWRWIQHHWESDSQSYRQLEDWGFFKLSDYSWVLSDISQADVLREKLYQAQATMPFLMDGIVTKADRISVRTKLGENTSAPNWAMAWKFPADRTMTSIRDISFSIGRTGKITALLQLEPVLLSGMTIKQVPVGSIKRLKALNIAPGDLISIALKGNAIPKLSKVVHRSKVRTVVHLPDQSRYTPFTCLHYSESCYQQFLSRIEWLSGRQGLNISELDSTIQKELIINGGIHEFADVLTLTPSKIMDHSTVSRSKATRIQKAITKALKPNFERQLLALSIPGIGKQRARQLANHFRTWDKLTTASPQEIANQTSLGKRLSKKMKDYLSIEEIKTTIRLLNQSTNESSNMAP